MSSVTSPLGIHGAQHPQREGGRRLRRIGIGVFFGSVAVNAALGIAALLIGEFSQTHGKILGTSLCVTGALLIALACMPAWERRALMPLPVVGAALGVVAFGLVAVSIWTDAGDTLGKAVGTSLVAAGACTLACLLVLPPLAARYRPVLGAGLVLTATAAVMAIGGIWIEPESSWYPRSFGVVGVLLAATAVSIPVLGKISGAEVETTVAVEPVAFCPYCGAEVSAAPTVDCGSCGRSFRVRAAMRARG